MLNFNDGLHTSEYALVVDDNPLMRMLLSSMLMHRGYAVTEVESAESALASLKIRNYDLVMLDIAMPGMSGIELCHLIRDEMGMIDLPVVAYTAHRDVTSVAHMRMAGFNEFLFKPVDAHALDVLLDDVVHH